MNPHALIIDDDLRIRETLADRLESLGHSFDEATSQEEGKEALRKARYDYVLLDLELPLRRGRPASLETGKNLLRDAVADSSLQRTGFIVITAFGHDSPDLAVEVMKIGAADFVRKPYHGLESAIRDFLKRRAAGGEDAVTTTGELRPFTGGELLFLPDRVDLNGVEICGDSQAGIIRHILEQLAHRDADGEFVRLPAKILALPFGDGKTQTVTDAINRFRDRATKVMRGAGTSVGPEDLVVTREGAAGYQLAATLTVRGEVAARTQIPERSREVTADERQKWFVGQLAAGKPLRRADLEDQFSISVATAKRDLLALRESVTFDAQSKSYRLKKGSSRR